MLDGILDDLARAGPVRRARHPLLQPPPRRCRPPAGARRRRTRRSTSAPGRWTATAGATSSTGSWTTSAAGGGAATALDVARERPVRGRLPVPVGARALPRAAGCALAVELKKVVHGRVDRAARRPPPRRADRRVRRRRCRSCSASSPAGPRDRATALSADDLAVDRELADLAGGFRFLLDLTPVDLPEARARRSRTTAGRPTFRYRDARGRPRAGRQAARRGPRATTCRDPTLASLLLAKHRELRLQLEMLACRGSDGFLALSIELYGAVDAELLAEAEAILDERPPPAPGGGPWLDAEAVCQGRPGRARPLPRVRARPRVARRGARGQHRGDGVERRRPRSPPPAGCRSAGSRRCSTTRSAPTSSPTSTAPTSRCTCWPAGSPATTRPRRAWPCSPSTSSAG